MKKLLILTAVVMLIAGAAGCRCCDWMWRGAACNPCVPSAAYAAPMSEPCPAPAYMPGPCDPCGSAAVTPGPAPYTLAPATVAPAP